jgi:protein-tyrosine phosphatase
MAYTEIHCHVLPGLDDGAVDLDDSLELAAVAAADGTEAMVATPHVRPDFVTDVRALPECVAELRAQLRRAGIELDLRCGGELGHELVGSLSQAELETIANGPPGRRWLLVETPFEVTDDSLPAATEELRQRGFAVVLAHPERSAGILASDRGLDLRAEIERGSLLQVNLWSLTGGHGAEAEAAGLALLRRGLVSVLASDSHPGWRRPTLSVGAAAARAAGLDRRAAEALVRDRPRALLRAGVAARATAGPLLVAAAL